MIISALIESILSLNRFHTRFHTTVLCFKFLKANILKRLNNYKLCLNFETSLRHP